MGKRSPSPPPAPDPGATAAAQAAANAETARVQAALNRIDEVTPYGKVTYSQTGSGDRGWLRTIELTPESRAALAQEQQLTTGLRTLANRQTGRVEQAVSRPFDVGGLPALSGAIGLQGLAALPGVNDFGTERLRVEESLMDRLRPEHDRTRAALETRLVNQGISPGSEAWREAIALSDRGLNDARMQAILAGGQEQSRLFGLASAARAQGFNERAAAAQFGNAARQQGFQERAYIRNLPLNEVAALMGTGQVQAPNFGAVPQVGVAPTDVIGPTMQAYQGQLASYNAAQQRSAQGMGSLFGLAGSVLGGWAGSGFSLGRSAAASAGFPMLPAMALSFMSTRSSKIDHGPAGPVLDRLAALPIHRWTYRPEFGGDGSMHIGPMAEDFRDAFGVGDGRSIAVVDVAGIVLAALGEIAQRLRVLESRSSEEDEVGNTTKNDQR